MIVQTEGDPHSSEGILKVREDGTLFKDWIAQFGNGVAVVRPDKYVYGIARNSDQLRAMISSIGRAM